MKLTKKEVVDHLSKNFLMQIATHGQHPWIATVYYSYDNDLNLYFISDSSTLHSKHIAKNPKVAVAIADSSQKPGKGALIGLQLWGKAIHISDRHKIVHLTKLWKTKVITSKGLPLSNMKKALTDGRIYRIEPKKIKLFNSVKYKDLEEGTEPLLKL